MQYPSFRKGPTLPVTEVSWDDCQVFVKRLNTHVANGGFRLPTEAEWEYACRAGTTATLNNGKPQLSTTWERCPNLDEIAWYGANAQRPRSVGEKMPNAWGLYDMHGNAAEVCQDWYGEYPSGEVTDPSGPVSGSYRVYRGRGWVYDYAGGCRSAYRGDNHRPDGRYAFQGLRLVRCYDLVR